MERAKLHLHENIVPTTTLFVHSACSLLCTHTRLCVRLLIYPLLSHTVVLVLLVHKIAAFVRVVVGVAFVKC